MVGRAVDPQETCGAVCCTQELPDSGEVFGMAALGQAVGASAAVQEEEAVEEINISYNQSINHSLCSCISQYPFGVKIIIST